MKRFDKLIERLSEKDCKCFGSCDGFLRKLYDDDNFYCTGNCFSCLRKAMLYLNEEYKEKIKLTKNEKIILEIVHNDNEYKYVFRNSIGEILFIDTNKIIKDFGDDTWSDSRDCESSSHVNTFDVFNDLFKFIKWEDEKPYEIKWLLENCEVVE